jgi:hypothetical protein
MIKMKTERAKNKIFKSHRAIRYLALFVCAYIYFKYIYIWCETYLTYIDLTLNVSVCGMRVKKKM